MGLKDLAVQAHTAKATAEAAQKYAHHEAAVMGMTRRLDAWCQERFGMIPEGLHEFTFADECYRSDVNTCYGRLDDIWLRFVESPTPDASTLHHPYDVYAGLVTEESFNSGTAKWVSPKIYGADRGPVSPRWQIRDLASLGATLKSASGKTLWRLPKVDTQKVEET